MTETTNELIYLSPSLLRIHPENMRRIYPAGIVGEMADSIKAAGGVIQALQIVPDAEPGIYLVVDGNLRLAAARTLGADCLRGYLLSPQCLEEPFYRGATMRSRKSHSIRPETVKALSERKNNQSLRRLAASLGYSEGFAATLSDVLRGKPGALSKDNEWLLRQRLGLDTPRRPGVTPTRATAEQDVRRRALGATWREIYEAGLATLEGVRLSEHDSSV